MDCTSTGAFDLGIFLSDCVIHIWNSFFIWHTPTALNIFQRTVVDCNKQSRRRVYDSIRRLRCTAVDDLATSAELGRLLLTTQSVTWREKIANFNHPLLGVTLPEFRKGVYSRELEQWGTLTIGVSRFAKFKTTGFIKIWLTGDMKSTQQLNMTSRRCLSNIVTESFSLAKTCRNPQNTQSTVTVKADTYSRAHG